MDPTAAPDLTLHDHPLAIRLFGPCELLAAGRRCGEELRKKALWLLAHLVLRRGQTCDRSGLAALFWPDSTQAQALYNLRRELTALRRALGSDGAPHLVAGLRTVALDPSGCWADVWEFDDAVRRADGDSLKKAVELHRGPLLDGCFEEWALRERERREADCVVAAESLARVARERGERNASEAWLLRVLELEPLRESAHRERIALLADCGEHAAAVSCYRELRLTLRRELGTEPDRTTTALFERIRKEARERVLERADREQTRAQGPRPRPGTVELPALPFPLTSLVGRAHERRAVAERLATDRLVTLTGPAGVGKTRLAVQVAHDCAEWGADGAAFVALSAVEDPRLVPEAIAAALGLRVQPGTTSRDAVVAFLAPRELLLVVDNCEHLGLGVTGALAELLQRLPDLRILATSRQSLGLAGEVVWRLDPLAVPDAEQARRADRRCLDFDGVRLFLERAGRASQAFEPRPLELQAVAEICSRLEGLPLALEIAAARTRSLPVGRIAAGLRDALAMLRGVRGSVERHQRTLEVALDWSHDLLQPEERTLLRRLSVFAEGFTLEAAEVMGWDLAPGEADVAAHLDALVDKSVVQFEDGRFRLLELVRQYAWLRLQESGEEGQARDRHLEAFEALAARAEPHFFGGFTAPEWRARLGPEHGNFRAALEHCEHTPAHAARGLRLAASLQWFWFAEGTFAVARRRLDAALSACGDSDSGRALALVARGYVAFWEGDESGMQAPLAESLAIWRRLEDDRGSAYAASILSCAPDRADARELADEALDAARRAADPVLVSIVLWWRGLLQERRGELVEARATYGELLELIRAAGHATGIGHALYPLGRVALALGEEQAAERYFEESLSVLAEVNNRWGMLAPLTGRARVAARLGRDADAARLLGAIDRLREALGATPTPQESGELRELEQELLGRLGRGAFAAQRAAGRVLDVPVTRESSSA